MSEPRRGGRERRVTGQGHGVEKKGQGLNDRWDERRIQCAFWPAFTGQNTGKHTRFIILKAAAASQNTDRPGRRHLYRSFRREQACRFFVSYKHKTRDTAVIFQHTAIFFRREAVIFRYTAFLGKRWIQSAGADCDPLSGLWRRGIDALWRVEQQQ